MAKGEESSDHEPNAEEVKSLEKSVKDNPLDYNTHEKYINILEKQGSITKLIKEKQGSVEELRKEKQGIIKKLRTARQQMSLLFPLTPKFWRQWASDETALRSGKDRITVVKNLYERGVKDYLSVSLWLDYLRFVINDDVYDRSGAGISKTRELFETAITSGGMHVTEGHRLWLLYRSFEQANLNAIAVSATSERTQQIKRIKNLFHRQLSIPLANIQETLRDYDAWRADHRVSIDVDKNGVPVYSFAYRKALTLLNMLLPLEETLDRDPFNYENYRTYLAYERSNGDPVRVQILYERAIAEFPMREELWLDYTEYMHEKHKNAYFLRDMHMRATRSCYWKEELWTRYLLVLERTNSSEEVLSRVFETALERTSSNEDKLLRLDIFLTRVDGLRRRLSSPKPVEADMDYYTVISDRVKVVFQQALNELSPFLNEEHVVSIYSYWARIACNSGKDVFAAREVWETLVKKRATKLGAWKAYISWEVARGCIQEARSLYRRCYAYSFKSSGSEDICKSWVQFEREYGTLEEMDFAVQKVAVSQMRKAAALARE